MPEVSLRPMVQHMTITPGFALVHSAWTGGFGAEPCREAHASPSAFKPLLATNAYLSGRRQILKDLWTTYCDSL